MTDTENDHPGMVDSVTADAVIAGLDSAAETPLFIMERRNVQNRRRKVPGSKAIINTATGDVVCLVSTRYNILQHSTAFAALTEAVRSLGLDGEARFAIEDDNDLVRVAAVFPTVTIPTQTGERIELGVRLTNSYNKTNSFHGEIFLYRPDIGGGKYETAGIAAPWARVGVPRMAKHHTTNSVMAIEQDIEDFISNVIGSVDLIGAIINSAADDPVLFVSEAQKGAFLRPVLIGQRHLEEVLPFVPDRTSRWELYTLVTTYTSLSSELTPLMRDNINDFAERRILEPKALIVPSAADAEAAEAQHGPVTALS